MEFSCTQENLHRSLLLVNQVIAKNVNLPILNNILVKIEDKLIHFSSTNLETAIQCTVRGKVERTGEFTFPAKLLLDCVSLLPKEERVDCEFLSNEGVIKIVCGSFESKIKGMAANDFPPLPVLNAKFVYRLPFLPFKTAIDQVIFAVSNTQSRPEISGVLSNFIFQKKEVVLAATDSFRLSESVKAISNITTSENGGDSAVIIPAKTFQELARIISVLRDNELGEDNGSFLEVTIGENQISFILPSCILISRVIEGKFPDYTYIIPENFKTEAILNKNEIIKAVKTASLFSRSGLFDVTFKFLPQEKQLLVSSSEEQRGNNSSVINTEIKGEENSVVLNYRYLLDGLQAIQSDKIVFKMNDTGMPCLLAPENQNERFRYIVMPIKQ